jgi:crotonobetainyl-CoA:carnitine CoA-transferase CaiB-like acyl-CoA transferase
LMASFGGKVPFGPVYDINEIARDAHFAARDKIVPVDHPGLGSPVRIAGVPIKLTETPGRVAHRAPRLGEHTTAVLASIGYETQEIERLRVLRIAV